MANANHSRTPESVETLDVEDRDRFIMVFDDVWQELKGKTALSVYMALKRRVNDDRKEWYGTHSTLSQESGVSPKTFQRCIEHLEEIGLVVTLRRFAPKGWDRKDGSRIVYSDRPGKGYEEIGKLYRVRFHVPVGKSDQTGGGKSDQTPPGKYDQTGGGKSDQQTYIPSDVDTSDIDTRSPLTPKGDDGASTAEVDPDMDRFQEFYDTYGRKKKRPDAERAWKKAVKKADPHMIIDAAAHFVASQKAIGKHPQYSPYPASWLNSESWNDEIDTPSRSTPTNSFNDWLPLTQTNAPELPPSEDLFNANFIEHQENY